MPTRAARRCTTPGCGGVPVGHGSSKCAGCQAVRARPRPTRQQLGYDEEWLAISADYRRRHPVCESCARRPSVHTDHRDGNVRNRAQSNLQALCKPCHSSKTAAKDGGFGNPVRRDTR